MPPKQKDKGAAVEKAKETLAAIVLADSFAQVCSRQLNHSLHSNFIPITAPVLS